MSLQVWLPLNGNLENQGLSNVTITNNGATVDNNGKIGKCYSFNGSSAKISMSINLTPAMSFCAWVKFNSVQNFVIDARNSSGQGYQPMYISSTGVQIYSSGSPSGGYISYSFSTGIWYHLVVSYSNNKGYLYVNGTLVGTIGVASLTLNNSILTIGSRYSSEGYFDGKLNDVRIYDHCLSAKEVGELAKGLVLHYRLSGPGQENLITGNFSCTSTHTTYQSQGTVGCVLTAADLMANQGRTLTLSYDVYSLGDYTQNTTGSWQADRFGIHGVVNYTKSGSSTSTQDYPLANLLSRGKSGRVFTSWKIPTGVTSFNTGLDFAVQTNGRDGYAYPASNNSSTWYLKNVKLEWGSIVTPWCPNPADALYSAMGYNNNIEYDCSGYRRNGTKSGTITWDIDSPRYTTSYSALSDYPIKAEVNMPSCDSMTVSFWTKITTFGTAKSGLFATSNMSTDPTDYNDTAMAQRDSDIDLKGVSGSGKIFNFTAPSTGQWHHCVFVYDGSKVYYYQDGKKINEEACAIGALKSYQYFYLGYSKAGGVVRKTLGKWSDLRIYTTALSAEDIAELYHSAVIVDNTGKNYAYEYFEA